MSRFEAVMVWITFGAAALMLFACWRVAPNRKLGAILVGMAVLGLVRVGLHADELRDGSLLALLQVFSALLFLGAGAVSFGVRLR